MKCESIAIASISSSFIYIGKIFNLYKIKLKFLLIFCTNDLIYEIIKLAVQNDGCAIKYVNLLEPNLDIDDENAASRMTQTKNRYRNEIIELAIINSYGIALKYIPIDKITDKLIKLAVQISYKSNNTNTICKHHGLALQFVPKHKMTNEIIELAVKYNGLSLEFVPEEKITNKIIELAIQNDYRALVYVPKDKMTQEIIKQVVQNNDNTIKFLDYYSILF
jgi:hypothetical protein